MTASERERLEDWAAAFERVYGWAPAFAPLARGPCDPPGDPPREPPGEPPEAFTCTFRPVFEPIDLLGNTGYFRHRPGVAAWFTRLGFGWTDEGRIVTAPSPGTFNALLDRLGPDRAGYRLAYIAEERGNFTLGPWLSSYLRGQLPVHVAPPAYYARRLAGAGAGHGGLGDLRFHFASFAHDLTVHALNYSAVPWSVVDTLRETITARAPERVAGWDAPEATAPLTLTTFFDNDLNRYCYEVWSRCEGPEDFARIFTHPRCLPQLLGALEVRLDETLAGKGDIPSADTRDLPPLAPAEFRLP